MAHDRLNLQEWHKAFSADLDAAVAELHAAQQHRLEVLCACESFVLYRASKGDVLASALADVVAESRRRNEAAVLEGQLALPAFEPPNRV